MPQLVIRDRTLVWDVNGLSATPGAVNPSRWGPALYWCGWVPTPNYKPPKAKKSSATITVSKSEKDVQKAVDAGSAVTLAPGLHTWEHAVALPPGAEITGYGAHVRRIPDGDYGERMFVGGQDATVTGPTLHPAGLAFHSNPAVTGLVARDTAIVGGQIGYGYDGVLFEDVEFDRCGGNGVPHGVYLRCRWRDSPGGAHAFYLTGPCVAGVALIDCEFRGTDRGPVFGTGNGAITDNLVMNLNCSDINRDDNGNEVMSAEGMHEYSRNLAVHARLRNCDGSAPLLWDAPARDNVYLDWVQEGGGGPWFAGVNDVEQSGNIIENFELRGGGWTLGWTDGNGRVHGAGVTGNVLRSGAFVGYKPSRFNQGRYDPSFYNRSVVVVAAHAAGPTNYVNADFVDLPAKVRAYENVSNVNCRVVRGEAVAAVSS